MDQSLKTAVIGANGLVGRSLFESFRRDHPDTLGTDWQGRGRLAKLDLADPDIRPLRLAETGHTWAVICAGIKDYLLCEHKKDFASQRNVYGTLALARKLHEEGIKVAFFSSDAVYGGQTGNYKENSPLQPTNQYAIQKAQVETGLRDITSGQALILRIGRIIGEKKGDGTLLDNMAQRLVSGQRVPAAWDQIFNPVLADDLPRVVRAAQTAGLAGPLNVGGPETWVRYDIALRLSEKLGVDKALVQKISLDDIGGDVPRPKNLSMDCGLLKRLVPKPLTALSACLDKVAANYKNNEEKLHAH